MLICVDTHSPFSAQKKEPVTLCFTEKSLLLVTNHIKKMLKFKKLGFVVASGLFLFAACNDTSQLPTPKTYKHLSKDERLDSILQACTNLDFRMMVDSIDVTGKFGLRYHDTTIINAVYPNRQSGLNVYFPVQIGNVDPTSPEKDKYALYTLVERFISIRAADTKSNYGGDSEDTSFTVIMRQFQRVSRAFDFDYLTISDYARDFPHEGTNEKVIRDSFIDSYKPSTLPWGGLFGGQFLSTATTYLGVFDNKAPESLARWYHSFSDIPACFFYFFKAGGLDIYKSSGFGIYWSELGRDEFNSMDVYLQKLSDGREHHVLFLKMPYFILSDDPEVRRFIRVRCVLD